MLPYKLRRSGVIYNGWKYRFSRLLEKDSSQMQWGERINEEWREQERDRDQELELEI